MKLLTMLVCTLFSAQMLVAQEKKPSISSLKWLTGCWQMNDKGRVTTERWGSATSNLILGTSQTVSGEKSVAFEFLRIVDNGHGMVYVARPSDAKNDTAFYIKSATDTELVFENLKHDFPQRIIYRREGKKKLTARIEGEIKGELKGKDFPYLKVKCD